MFGAREHGVQTIAFVIQSTARPAAALARRVEVFVRGFVAGLSGARRPPPASLALAPAAAAAAAGAAAAAATAVQRLCNRCPACPTLHPAIP